MPSQALAQFINNQSQPQILTTNSHELPDIQNSLWILQRLFHYPTDALIEHNDKARPTSPEETEEQKSKVASLNAHAKYYLQSEDNVDHLSHQRGQLSALNSSTNFYQGIIEYPRGDKNDSLCAVYIWK